MHPFRIKSITFHFLICVLCFTSIRAQENLPVLKAKTRSLDVREGHNRYKGYWQLSPEVKKDIYFAHRFKKKTTIVFYSGTDSVAFQVTPRHTYDFIILLNNKDTCYTEISTIRSDYYKDCSGCLLSADTIPFRIGKDNRIYLTGFINGSAPLKFFFDDGADNTVLFPSAFQKGAKVKFDDSVADRATGGIQNRQIGNFNDLEISSLKWQNEQVMYVDKQIGEGDGTIGYNLFEDKIIELDYEKGLMIIHDSAIAIQKGFAAFPMQMHGGEVPSLTATLINRNKEYVSDFLFDMGATGCLFLSQGFLRDNSLYGTMDTIGSSQSTGAGIGAIKTTVALLPGFRFGGHLFKQVPINLENIGEHDPGTGVLGMDILKRFNTIIDYQNNVIYLKPNRLVDSPFKQSKGSPG